MTIRTSLVLSIAGLLAGAAAFAGPPNPPTGPVGPTMKPLDQVEPRTPISAATTPGDADSLFRITQPGSYYLTGNLVGQDGMAGIEITSGAVTIDLGGFDLVGTPLSLDGIRTSSPNLAGIAIVNGSVRSWGGDGIDLATELGASCRVADVSAVLNGRHGIFVGTGSAVARCTARGNGVTGMNNAAGIHAGPGSSVTGCAAESNTGHGIIGNAGSTITDCAARSNTGDGIRVASGSTVTDCSAHSNSLGGISAPSGWLSHPYGVVDGNGATISDCSVSGNSAYGVRVNSGSTVSGCTARNNGAGIMCSSRCTIRGNTVSGNTGSGIAAGDTANVIDGNTCTDNAKGIEVTFGGTLIIRNTCSHNGTDWSIAPNNRLGPIVVCSVNPSPINGTSAPGTLNTADPFANITY